MTSVSVSLEWKLVYAGTLCLPYPTETHFLYHERESFLNICNISLRLNFIVSTNHHLLYTLSASVCINLYTPCRIFQEYDPGFPTFSVSSILCLQCLLFPESLVSPVLVFCISDDSCFQDSYFYSPLSSDSYVFKASCLLISSPQSLLLPVCFVTSISSFQYLLLP